MLCSNVQDLQNHISKVHDKFIEVHYPEKIIQEQFKRIQKVNRKDLILKPRRTQNKKLAAAQTLGDANLKSIFQLHL